MSSSPKHTTATLRREREERLRQARQRQAALERQRRAEEERRRQRERLAAAQNAARAEQQQLERQLSGFAQAECGQYVAEGVARARRALGAVAATIDAAREESDVQSARAELDRLGDELAQLKAEGEAARLASHLAREEAALELVRQRFRATDGRRAEKFDRPGRRAVEEELRRAESALARKDPQRAARITADAQNRLQAHAELVQQRFAEWSRRRESAQVAVDGAHDRVSSLRGDAVVVRWQAPAVRAMEERLHRLSALVETEQFDAAEAEAAKLLEQSEGVVAEADKAQLTDDKRNYIVHGIVEVMKRQGFEVQDGFPAHERPQDAGSPVLIYASRLGGGAVAVSVPQDGQIWYDVEGFDFHAERRADGGVIRSCDEAEKQLNSLHAALDEAFGIETSELSWEGKDPDRRKRYADQLPTSSSSAAPRTRAR